MNLCQPAVVGKRSEPDIDLLSNILKTFNDLFGNIEWTDGDRVRRLITEEIPLKVAADNAYLNARKHSDKQNARIEHDKALARVMTAVLKDDTELFKQFSDNESFRKVDGGYYLRDDIQFCRGLKILSMFCSDYFELNCLSVRVSGSRMMVEVTMVGLAVF